MRSRVTSAGKQDPAAELPPFQAAAPVIVRPTTALARALRPVEVYAGTEQEQLLGAQLQAQEQNVKLLEGQLGAGAVSPAEVTRERIAWIRLAWRP